MRVELDVYSGRENPSWELPPNEARQLIDRVAGKAVTPVEAAEAVLGFRGYIISVDDDSDAATAAGLPPTFRIGGTPPPEFAAQAAAPADETQAPPSVEEVQDASRWLLGTAAEAIDDELRRVVEAAITAPPAAVGAEAVAAACVIQNTPYNPGFWNTPTVQPRNNCYNYAMNYRSDTFAQPGRISGRMYTQLTCADVGAAADRDGCRAVCSGSNKTVALVIWPGRDFHWYRLHSNGFWGHKPGSTAARNTDNRGRVIGGALNPANCDRGPYTQFCGYRFSPTGMHVR